MGGGFYDYRAHEATTVARAAKPIQVVFSQTACHPLMDPKGLRVREARDSLEHPNSRAILFGVDVTKSMGPIPEGLAKRTLPQFMRAVLRVIPHPQICFVGIGDALDGDRAPLQVGEFESSNALIDASLTRLYIEGGGGSIGSESYENMFYLAARHTAIDCWEKRREKGYLFLTGDETPYPNVVASTINRLIGPGTLSANIPIETIIAEASVMYHPFFFIPDQGRSLTIERSWRNKLGDAVIVLQDPEDTSVAAAILIGLCEGVYQHLDDVRQALATEFGRKGDTLYRVVSSIEAYAASIGLGGARRPVLSHGVQW